MRAGEKELWMDDELEEYIETLRSEGEAKCESGQFTVDPFKSSQKLELFRLAEPELCVLPFISAAVLGGATVVDVSGSFRGFTITFDGKIWTHETFPELLGSEQEAARELQIGFSAAQALEPERIQLVSRLGPTVSELTIVDGMPSFVSRDVDYPGHDTNTIKVVNCAYESSLELYQLLQQRVCFNPRVAWRGHRLIRKSPPHTAARLELTNPTLDKPSVVVSAWVACKLTEQPCSGHVWTTATQSENSFTFLIRSVAYKKDVKFKKYRGLHGVINAPTLRLDISRGGIVEDREYLKLVESLEHTIDTRLMPQVKRELRGMPSERKVVAQRFLEQWKS